MPSLYRASTDILIMYGVYRSYQIDASTIAIHKAGDVCALDFGMHAHFLHICCASHIPKLMQNIY